MVRTENFRCFRHGVVPFLLGLCLLPAFSPSYASSDGACQPPLRTAEYELSAPTWDAALQASIRDRDLLLEALGKRKTPPSAKDFLALGRLIEKHFGYHYLAFEFYDRALELANQERGKKREQIKSEVESRQAALAARQLQALRDLILEDSEQTFVSPELIVLPSRNLIERRDMTLGNDQFLARYEQLAAQYYKKTISESEFHRRLDLIRAETRKLTHRDVFSSGEGLPSFTGFSEVSSWYFRTGVNDDELLAKRFAGFAIVPEGFHLEMTHEPFIHKASKFLPEGMLDTPGVRRITEIRYKRSQDDCPLTSYTVGRKDGLLGEFLERFPEYRAEAAGLIERVVFEVALQSDRAEHLRLFLRAFPESPYAATARNELERRRFEGALAENSPASFKAYLDTYPDGAYRIQAQSALTKAEYEEAVELGTEDALVEFLERYPESEWESAARNQIARISFYQARGANTIESYQAFIRAYPESQFVTAAGSAIEAIRAGESFSAVRKLNTIAGYERFLSDYPNSVLRHEAQTLIGFLTARLTGQMTDYEVFFDLRRDLEDKSMVEEEYRLALSDVAQQAKSEAEGKGRGAKAHALVYRETGDLSYLRRAWSLRLIKSPEVELYVLRNLSSEEVATIFDFVERQSDLGATADRTWFWASPVVSSRPTIETVFASAAKYTYRIKVELAVQVDYERYFYGIEWLAPEDANKTWSKIYRSTAFARVGPLPSISEPVTFQFPRFELYRESGTAVYSFRTEGQIHNPTHRIVAIDLAE